MQRFDKYPLQTLGFALVVLGFLLFIIALLGGVPGFQVVQLTAVPPAHFSGIGWVFSLSFLVSPSSSSESFFLSSLEV
jgi:hypothetical protein